MLACEALNAAYSAYSTNKTLKEYSESVELLQSQLNRVNDEIAQCPAEDTRRLQGLMDIRSDLTEAISEALRDKIGPDVIPLEDAGWSMARAGMCGLLILVPPL